MRGRRRGGGSGGLDGGGLDDLGHHLGRRRDGEGRHVLGAAQRAHEGQAALVPLVRGLGESLDQDGVEGGGQLRALLGDPRRFVVEVGPQLREVVVAPVGRVAGEHLVDHAGEAVDVAPAVDRFAVDLLGGDVVEGADELADGGETGERQRLLGEPEVGEVDVLGVVAVGTLGDQDVARFDVAVDEFVGVRRVQRRGDLGGDPDGLAQRQRPLAVQQGPQVAAADVAHRDEEQAVGLPGLVDRDDVRVVDGGRDLGLAGEPLAEHVVAGQVGGEQLDGDGAAQAQVLGAVDDGHTAPADHFVEAVAGEPVAGQVGGGRGRHAASPLGWEPSETGGSTVA
ncbi:hypothetical protein GCM10025734_75670 [Kitasatospora paranensis]